MFPYCTLLYPFTPILSRTYHSHVSSIEFRHGNNDTACIYYDINKYRTCLRAVLLTVLACLVYRCACGPV